MKTFSIAIFLIAFSATNVFAAPSDGNEVDEILAEFLADKDDVIDPAVIIAQYECFVKVLQEESEANGLGNLWSLSKKRFASNIAKWKKCGTYSSATGAVCHFSQGYTAFGLVKEYLKVAHQKDPVFYARVLPKYVKNCALPNPTELVEKFDDAATVLQGMKCVVSMSDEKLAGTQYQSIWRARKIYFNGAIQKFDACFSDKCRVKIASEFQDSFNGFIFQLRSINEQFGQTFGKAINEECGF